MEVFEKWMLEDLDPRGRRLQEVREKCIKKSLIICTLRQILLDDDQFKENDMREMRNAYAILVGKLEDM
jgi:hypothetical protein